MTTQTEETTTVVKGIDALTEMIPFLAPLVKAIQTPCEGFIVTQLGHYPGNEDGISGASLVFLKVGGEHPQHMHRDSENTFRFISGRGYVILGEEKKRIPYFPETVIKAPRGVLHGFEALESGFMLALHSGEPIIKDDGSMDIHYTDPRCFTEHGTVGGD